MRGWGGEGLSKLRKTFRERRSRAFDCLLAKDYSEIAEDDKGEKAVDDDLPKGGSAFLRLAITAKIRERWYLRFLVLMRFTSLFSHISLFLGRFTLLFGVSVFLVGIVKTLINFPNFASSDLAMSVFGVIIATLLSRKSFAQLMSKLATPRGESILLLISLIVCLALAGLKLTFGGSNFYENFLGENSVVEWLTTLFLLLSAYFVFLIGFSKGSPFPKWLFFALSLIFFAAGMEELSWGQMIFNWDTPKEFASLNSQSEITLHNIYGINKLIDPALLLFSLTSAYFSLQRIKPNSLHGIDYLKFSKGLFPMLFMAAIFSAATIFFRGEVFLGRISQDIEWAEFLIAGSIFMQSMFLIASSSRQGSN